MAIDEREKWLLHFAGRALSGLVQLHTDYNDVADHAMDWGEAMITEAERRGMRFGLTRPAERGAVSVRRKDSGSPRNGRNAEELPRFALHRTDLPPIVATF